MTTLGETITTADFPHALFTARTSDAFDSSHVSHDYELAQRVAAGDVAAFEQLYQAHHRRIYLLCLRMTSNAAEAEDLTQEVFIKVFRRAGSFRGGAAFTTWLHRLTVNQVLMYFRKPFYRTETTTEDGELPIETTRDAPDAHQTPIIDRIALNKAIAKLSPGYRTVFVLHDIEGMEHHEIARQLGCSEGTSKSQLHKARMRLRRLLKRSR